MLNQCFMAVDPGRDKCGLAIMAAEKIIFSGIVMREALMERLTHLLACHQIDFIAIGDKTGSKDFCRELKAVFGDSVKTVLIDEHNSTFQARALYWRDHPPSGLWRFIPLSLRKPSRAIDDYAAEVLAWRVVSKVK